MKFTSTLLGLYLLSTCTMSWSQTASPHINATQAHQAQRIEQGAVSDELTKKEAITLRNEQRAIRAEKQAFKSDGKLTKSERTQVRRDQQQASRHIYKKKHNARKTT